MNTGYTHELPEEKKLLNLYNTCLNQVNEKRDNTWWANSFLSTVETIHGDQWEKDADTIASFIAAAEAGDEYLSVGDRVAMAYPAKPQHSPMIQKAIDNGTLDKNGGLLPYKSTRNHAIADNHESHSYTWDGS